ncbi:MAG: hypothetical protein LBD55_04915 [Treponema sp.]|jgi:hypothetical protein|nr:hypothetical protein [Treponema sp.]
MKTKKLKVINKLDKIDARLEYIFLKQLSAENCCNLFPKTLNEIKKEVDKILYHHDDFIISINYNESITGVGVFLNEPNKKYLECLGVSLTAKVIFN